MSFYDAIRVGASGAADFEIERSLRFNDDDSPLLTRTFGSAGNRKTWTLSCWLKRSNIDTYQGLLAVGTVDGSEDFLGIDTSNRLNYRFNVGSDLKTLALFRDVGAWYHIVVVLDTTQSQSSASASDSRLRFYINGVRQTEWDESDMPSQNFETRINNNVLHYIGEYPRISSHLDGYLAEFNFIDGQAYDPTYFAETNEVTGQWIPKKYAGSYGTTGFRLQFADNSGTTATTLGKDTSGQGNNWTPSGFSVSAGVGNDSLEDTPTNNFCTSNSLVGYTTNYATFSNGNLDFNLAANSTQQALGSFLIPETGKWYAEYVFSSGALLSSVGIRNPATLNSVQLNGINILQFTSDNSSYSATPQLRIDNSYSENLISGYGNNDIIGVKVDRDNGTIQFTKNGSNNTTAVNLSGASDTSQLVFVANRSQGGSFVITGSVNFGQRPFSYLPTGYKSLCSQNLPDPTILLSNKHFNTLLYTGNGAASGHQITGLNFQPDWVWIKNRTETYDHMVYDSIRGAGKFIESNTTDAEATGNHMDGFLSNGISVGDGSSSNRTNLNGIPYVAWNWDAGETDSATYRVVVVSDSGNKYRFRNSANTATFAQSAVTLDLAEGGTYTFDQSDSTMSSHPMKLSTTANGTHGGGSSYNTGVTYQLDGSSVTESAFVSGFSSATSRKLIITVAASAPTLYYYCHYHSGMGGQANTNSTLGSSNFDGSTQSTVKANTTAGFSIVLYTGQQNASDTIGHGLGVKPQVVISKSRNSTYTYTRWYVHHHKLTTNYLLFLDDTNAQVNGLGDYYIDSSFSSTVFAVGNDIYGPNVSNNNYVAYCFSEVAGYSKFGSYTGNGSANGTFVFTGFRPAWVMIKRTSGTQNWRMFDNKRNPFNDADLNLQANTNGAEFESSAYNALDFLSNGFKLRGTNADEGTNQNGQTYIYLAFAKSPFKNARAR